MPAEKISLVPSQRTKKVIKLEPPDGGWGWMVLIGVATSNIFNQSMLSLFGFLYGDALEAMGHRTQGATIVLSTMLFVSNFGGPIAGAVVKLTSTRFVSVLGAVSCTLGIFISGFATNIMHLVISYGVLLGLGLGFIQNSSYVAINSYFNLKKSQAVGLANVGTGVGQTLMPHLVRYLLDNYGFRGTCLMLSGLSLHGIAGTMLIHPVEWHLKKVVEEVPIEEAQGLLNENRKVSLPNGDSQKIELQEKSKWSSNQLNGQSNGAPQKSATVQRNNFLSKLYDLFGIALLSDIRFLNIVIGIALAVTSTQNFSMLYPFFLQKVALMDKQQTANCMSAVAGADIAGRLILPVFQDKYKIKARWMLIMTCAYIIIVRQILAYQTNVEVLIAMSCFYGFGRSMIIVARNIAISEHCRMDQVPAAVGLGMLTMGIVVPPAGYLLAWIRDFTDNYITCITAQNALVAILLITWIPDMLYLKMKERRTKQNDPETL